MISISDNKRLDTFQYPQTQKSDLEILMLICQIFWSRKCMKFKRVSVGIVHRRKIPAHAVKRWPSRVGKRPTPLACPGGGFGGWIPPQMYQHVFSDFNHLGPLPKEIGKDPFNSPPPHKEKPWTCDSTQRTKWGKKMKKSWGKMRENVGEWEKIRKCPFAAHLGLKVLLYAHVHWQGDIIRE